MCLVLFQFGCRLRCMFGVAGGGAEAQWTLSSEEGWAFSAWSHVFLFVVCGVACLCHCSRLRCMFGVAGGTQRRSGPYGVKEGWAFSQQGHTCFGIFCVTTWMGEWKTCCAQVVHCFVLSRARSSFFLRPSDDLVLVVPTQKRDRHRAHKVLESDPAT